MRRRHDEADARKQAEQPTRSTRNDIASASRVETAHAATAAQLLVAEPVTLMSVEP